MFLVFVLLMSAVILFYTKNYYTYLGSCKDPNPYLLAFWLIWLAFSFMIEDTDFLIKANTILCYMFKIKFM